MSDKREYGFPTGSVRCYVRFSFPLLLILHARLHHFVCHVAGALMYRVSTSDLATVAAEATGRVSGTSYDRTSLES
jgi:hypothetical protein